MNVKTQLQSRQVNGRTTFQSENRQSRPHAHRGLLAASTAAVASLFLPSPAVRAANSTWLNTGSSSANWSDTTNWVGGVAPGATSGTTDTSVATFNTAVATFGTTGNPILIDSGRNIDGITFDTASVGAFFIGTTGGNALLLSNGGIIQATSSINNSETINAPLVIEGSNATYTFNVNASTNNKTIKFAGGISGGAAGNTVLTLLASGTGTNSITGIIGDGSATHFGVTVSSGLWSLGATNTYSGATTINGGTVSVAGGLGNTPVTLNGGQLTIGAGLNLGSNSLTIAGGTLDASTAGTLANNLAQAWNSSFTFVGSQNLNLGTGAVTLGNNDTVTVNASTLTVGGAIGGAYTLTKAGAGTLILNGTDTYSGGTTINAGTLGFAASALPSTGSVLINNSGVLQASGPYSDAAAWVNSGRLSTSSSGSIALTTDSSSNIDLTVAGYSNLMLGATGNSNYTGTLTPVGGVYRLGGGSATLTLPNLDALTSTNSLIMGEAGSTLKVALSNANDLSGATTVNYGTLALTASASNTYGTVANSALTFNAGTSLTVDTANATIAPASETRASSITLSGSTMIVTGTAVGATDDVITNALTLNNGFNTITVTPALTTSAELSAASLVRGTGAGIGFVNGVGLGKDSTSTANVGRIIVTSAPTLVGTTAALSTGINAASQNTQIVPFLIGEATSTTGGVGTKTGTPDTFVTFNATTGLRPLNPTDEFTQNAITAGNNTRITTATASSANAAINSLLIAGNTLTITDGTTLTDSSGAVLFASTNSIAPSSSTGALGFGSNEALVSVNSTFTGTISAVITGSGGLTKSGPGSLTLSGANTFTGNVTLQAGTLTLSNSNTYSGLTSVLGGTLAVAVAAPSGANGALGNATSAMLLGDTSGSANAGLQLTSTGTFGRNITVQAGNTGTATITGSASSATATVSGNVVLGSTLGGTPTGHNLTLNAGSFDTLNMSGSIQDPASSGVVSPGVVTVSGSGTAVELAGSSSFTGGVIVNGALRVRNANALGTGTVTILGGSMGGPGFGESGGAITIANNQIWAGDFTGGTSAGSTLTSTGTDTIVNGPRKISIDNVGLTINGVISDGGNGYGLTLVGGGTGGGTENITLGGSNTFSGGLTLNGGSVSNNTTNVILNNASAVGTGPLTINSAVGLLALQNGTAGSLSANNSMTWNTNFSLTGNTFNLGTGAVSLGTSFGTARTLTVTNTSTVGGVISNGTTATGITKAGAGTLVLLGSNTYSGPTVISAGILSTNLLASEGSGVTGTTASGIGQSNNAAANLVLSGGTLQYTGPTVSTDRNFTFGNATTAAGATIDASGTGPLTISGSMTGANVTAGTQTFTLTGTNTGLNTLSGNIVDSSGTALTAVTKSGVGTWVLSGTSTYSGTTNINGGILQVTTNSNLGSAASGMGFAGGTLQIGGTSATFSTSRAITLNAGGGTIDTGDVTNSATFSGNITNGANALILTGSGSGTYSGVIGSGATPTGTVTKNGTGTWTFSGANLYSGNTTINAGTVHFSTFTGSSANSAVTVASGLTLAIDSSSGTPVASVTRAKSLTLNSDTVTVAGTSAANTVDAITGALSLASGINTITVNPDPTKAAKVTAGNLARTAPSVAFINGTNLGADSTGTTAGNSYILFGTAPTFVGSTTNGGSGSGTTTTLGIIPTLVGEVSTTAGGGGTVTGTPNTFLTYNSGTGLRPLDLTNEYTTDSIVTGNNTRIVSGATAATTTNVNSLVMAGGNLGINNNITLTDSSGALLFSANGSSITTGTGTSNLALGSEGVVTVDSGVTGTINNSLTATTLTKSGTGTLVLSHMKAPTMNILAGKVSLTNFADVIDAGFVGVAAGAILDYTSDGGVADNMAGISGAGNIQLGNSSLIIASNTSTLTGVVSGTGGITFGSGFGQTLTLGGTDTYSGPTTINGGTTVSTLVLSVANAITQSSQVDIAGIMNLDGNNQSIVGLSGAGTVTSTVAGNLLLSITGGTSPNFTGIIQNGTATSLSLSKTTTGTQTLSGTNTYTGTTSVTGGTLIAGNNVPVGAAGAFGNASSAITMGDATTTSGNTSPSLLIGGAFTVARPVTVANQASTGTYSIGGSTDSNSVFSGLITVNQPLTVSQATNAGSNALSITGGITSGNAGNKIVTFAGPGNIDVNTVAITDGGTGTLAVTATGGITTFGTAETYSGNTNANGGTLTVTTLPNTANVNVNNSGTIFNAVSYNAAAPLAVGASAMANISGTGLSLAAVSDAGNVNFTSATGTTTLAGLTGAGTTAFTASGSVPAITGGSVTAGSNLNVTGAGISAGSASSVTATVTTLTGTGILTTTGATGITTVSGGTLNASGVATIATMSAGTANLSGSTSSVTTLNGGSLALTGTALTVNNGSYGGGISGNGSLATGSGPSDVLTLSGSNTYSGTTNVNAGTLLVTNSTGSATGSGNVTVNSPASLGGNGTISGSVTVNSGGTIFTGLSSSHTSAATLTVGPLTLGGSTVLNLTSVPMSPGLGGSDEIVSSGLLNFGGSLTVNDPNGLTYAAGDSFDLFSFGSHSGSFTNSFPTGLPTLTGGLTWNTSTLYTNGIISIGGGTTNGNDSWTNGGLDNTWENSANWLGGHIPGVAGNVATFSDTSVTGPVNPNLTANETVGGLTFNGNGGLTTISASTGKSLTLDNSGSGVAVGVTGGNVAISAPVILNDNATATVNGSNTLTVSGAVTATGAQTLTDAGTGTLVVATTGSIGVPLVVSGNVSFATNGSSGGLLVTPTIPSITIHNGGVVTVTDPGAGNHANRTVLATNSLNFDGSSGAWQGKLDLAGNDMVVHAGASTSTVLANITNQLAQGYNGATPWTGTAGIVSSTAAADNTVTGLSTLGVATGLTSFDGESVLSSDVLVKYTYYGDATLDGHVDGSDYSMIDTGFAGGGTGWQYGDFNYDGHIDGSDYSLIDNTFNQQSVAGFAAEVAVNTSEIAGGSAAVPEPASLGLLGIGAIGLMSRRRRRV
jgi:fibronectin-binding autotransporter adhesin